MDLEEWKDVKGFEGLYQVSNMGNFKSLDRVTQHNDGRVRRIKGKVIEGSLSYRGYIQVTMSKNGVITSSSLHRLVAKTFLGEPPTSKHVVNHIDGNPTNNSINNLEWVTQKVNAQHAVSTGLVNYKTYAKYKDLGYYINDELVDVYESVKHASDVLGINYFTILKSIKENRKLRDGSYFTLHENSNDYSLGK